MRPVLSVLTLATIICLGPLSASADDTCVDAVSVEGPPRLRRALSRRLRRGLLTEVSADSCRGAVIVLTRGEGGLSARLERDGATVRRSVESPVAAATWIESWLVPGDEHGPTEGAFMELTNTWRTATLAAGLLVATAHDASAELPPAPWADTPDVPGAASYAAPRAARSEAATAEQLQALRQLEDAVTEFEARGQSFRDTVDAVTRRRYLSERRNRAHHFDRRILAELSAERAARETAIHRFERFLRLHPDDPDFTPGAMHRLGELYYERAVVAFYERQEGEPQGVPDFGPTVALYRDLLTRYPSYPRRASVHGLLGYYLFEMGELDEARDAWLALVCPRQTPSAGGPYAGCRSATHPRVTEAWFRLGELHFDDPVDPDALARAIGAYEHVLAVPSDRRYAMALYKIAWAYYRTNRFPEAIEHFARLVDHADAEERRTGVSGSELRPEAIQYIALSFAWDDWDSDGVADVQARGAAASGSARVQREDLLAQDRHWTPEVYRQLGAIYFDEARYDAALEVWQTLLARWPTHCARDEVLLRAVEAHDRAGRDEASFGVLEALSQPVERGRCDAATRRRSALLAREALLEIAYRHHRRAQELRQRCAESHEVQSCAAARDRYAKAVMGYEGFLSRHPGDASAEAIRFQMANALYWSGRYEESARAYAAVRDSNGDDGHVAAAARGVVDSIERLVEGAGLEVAGEEAISIETIEMPLLLKRLGSARDAYLARVPPRRDADGLRAPYDFNNARLASRFGHLEYARARLGEIIAAESRTTSVAWLLLRDIAVSMGDDEAVAQLASAVTSGTDCDAIRDRCAGEERDPACVACRDTTALCFRHAQSAGSPEQLLACADRAPMHPDALAALEQAALLYAEAGRHGAAENVYRRLVATLSSTDAATAALRASALFGLASSRERLVDLEGARRSYDTLLSDTVLAASDDPAVARLRSDALVNAGLLAERMQRYVEAQHYFEQASEVHGDAAVRLTAAFRAGEVAFVRGAFLPASRAMRSFLATHGRDPEAAGLSVRAAFVVAEAEQRLGHRSAHLRALRDTVTRYSAAGGDAGSEAAEAAAHAHFLVLENDLGPRTRFAIEVRGAATTRAYAEALRAEIAHDVRRAGDVVEAYEALLEYGRPTWSIAALRRQAEVYEALGRAIDELTFTTPRDLARTLRRVDRASREEVVAQLEGTLRDALSPDVRAVECLAITRHLLALRAARVASAGEDAIQGASDRLLAFGVERVSECANERHAVDPTFDVLGEDELHVAPSGRRLGATVDSAPPALSR
jgi:tetratricopeptide (TPR) repeat protein